MEISNFEFQCVFFFKFSNVFLFFRIFEFLNFRVVFQFFEFSNF